MGEHMLELIQDLFGTGIANPARTANVLNALVYREREGSVRPLSEVEPPSAMEFLNLLKGLDIVQRLDRIIGRRRRRGKSGPCDMGMHAPPLRGAARLLGLLPRGILQHP